MSVPPFVSHVPGVLVGLGVLLGGFSAHAEASILYLNPCRGGVTVWPGWGDDSRQDLSEVLDVEAELPPFPYSDDSWNTVVDTTRALFAPFDLEVTDIDPGDVSHDEVFVCGSAEDAGLSSGYWGLAPYDCDAIQDAISFVFPEEIGDVPKEIGETVAQEAAHAWGLDHSYSCRDPMGYLSGCGNKRFLDRPVSCGEYLPRRCGCGEPTQNTYEHLAWLLGERPRTDSPADVIDAEPGVGPDPPRRPSRGGCAVTPAPGSTFGLWVVMLGARPRRSTIRQLRQLEDL